MNMFNSVNLCLQDCPTVPHSTPAAEFTVTAPPPHKHLSAILLLILKTKAKTVAHGAFKFCPFPGPSSSIRIYTCTGEVKFFVGQ